MRNVMWMVLLGAFIVGTATVQASSPADGTYRLDYMHSSVGAAWFNDHADKSTTGNQFDYTTYDQVPAVAPITVSYDPSTLSANITGGGVATSRHCTQKSATENLSCDLFNLNMGSEVVKGCHDATAESELVNISNNQVAYYARLSFHLLLGGTQACGSYKTQLKSAIQAGTAAPFWKALHDSGAIKNLDNLEDDFALAHVYMATRQ